MDSESAQSKIAWISFQIYAKYRRQRNVEDRFYEVKDRLMNSYLFSHNRPIFKLFIQFF